MSVLLEKLSFLIRVLSRFKSKRPASNLRLQVSCLLAGLLLVTTVSARRFRVHILFL